MQDIPSRRSPSGLRRRAMLAREAPGRSTAATTGWLRPGDCARMGAAGTKLRNQYADRPRSKRALACRTGAARGTRFEVRDFLTLPQRLPGARPARWRLEAARGVADSWVMFTFASCGVYIDWAKCLASIDLDELARRHADRANLSRQERAGTGAANLVASDTPEQLAGAVRDLPARETGRGAPPAAGWAESSSTAKSTGHGGRLQR